jgi:hypothetical protein
MFLFRVFDATVASVLPLELDQFYICYLGNSLPMYALSRERIYNYHLYNDAYTAVIVAVV